MRYAVECGYVAADPTTSVMTPRVEAPSTRLRYLTPEQVRTLIEKTPASGRVLVVTAALTGLRKGELLALTFGDIDVEQRTIRVSKTMRNGIVTSPKTALEYRVRCQYLVRLVTAAPGATEEGP